VQGCITHTRTGLLDLVHFTAVRNSANNQERRSTSHSDGKFQVTGRTITISEATTQTSMDMVHFSR
jgi:hypothetical protein